MSKKLIFWLTSIGVLLVTLNALQNTKWNGSKQYEVISVYNGAVQVKNIQSGEITNIYDDSLVRQALSGKIKSGDTLSLK